MLGNHAEYNHGSGLPLSDKNWLVKSSQKSFQESMLLSGKVLNQVIADPIKVSETSSHFTNQVLDVVVIHTNVYMLNARLDLLFRHNFVALKASLMTL